MCVMLYPTLLAILYVYFCSPCLQLLPVALKYYDAQTHVDSSVARIENSLLEIQKSEKKLSDLVNKFETQLHDHHKSVGNMFTDHVSSVDARVTKCCEALASSSSSASSFVAANIVQELEDKKRRKNNVLFFNISERNTPNSEADLNYVSKLCKDTFDFDAKILKAFRLGKKVPNKCRPLLVHFENENAKAGILGKSYLLKSKELYSSIYVSADMTKSERIKHRQLVDELKSRRAGGETNIFIRGSSIITKPRSINRPVSNTNTSTSETPMESSS